MAEIQICIMIRRGMSFRMFIPDLRNHIMNCESKNSSIAENLLDYNMRCLQIFSEMLSTYQNFLCALKSKEVQKTTSILISFFILSN